MKQWVIRMARNPDKKKCSGTNKETGKPCGNWAMRGKRACKLHGGAGGAPAGNRNALKTGVDEKVVLERLTPYERALFEATNAEPDLTFEMRVLRFKMLRLLDDLKREMVVATPEGAHKVTLKVDEIQKAYAIEKLVDGARKLAKELDGGEGARFEQLLAALMAPPPGEEE